MQKTQEYDFSNMMAERVDAFKAVIDAVTRRRAKVLFYRAQAYDPKSVDHLHVYAASSHLRVNSPGINLVVRTDGSMLMAHGHPYGDFKSSPVTLDEVLQTVGMLRARVREAEQKAKARDAERKAIEADTLKSLASLARRLHITYAVDCKTTRVTLVVRLDKANTFEVDVPHRSAALTLRTLPKLIPAVQKAHEAGVFLRMRKAVGRRARAWRWLGVKGTF